MSTSNLTERLEHLEWAVESRAKNQRSAVRLLRLFRERKERWKSKRLSRAAQDLLSASFSLWRAAFLADKRSQREDVFAHAVTFLETIVEDNAISYPHDRKCKNWTFNYYTRNARSSLESLNSGWPQLRRYERTSREPTERWNYCQELLDEAIDVFESFFNAQDVGRAKALAKQAGRKAKKEKKRKSRAVTIAARGA